MVVVCVGGGPSLLAADVAACRGKAFVLAINNAVHLAPWAEAVLGGDLKWWKWNRGLPRFTGRRFTCHGTAQKAFPDLERFRISALTGLDLTPGWVCSGGNSGYAAINIAVHLGARQILLLGYDMQPSDTGADHWHAPHPDGTHPGYGLCLPRFTSLVDPLAALGIDVVNCSRVSAMTIFPRRSIQEALA